jgi:WD40 repeat protein
VTQLQLLPPSGAPDAAGPDAALLSCSLDGRVIIWDARAGSSAGGLAAALAAPRSAPLQCVAAQGGGGPLIAAGTRDGAVLVWDVRRPDAPAAECCGHGDWVTQLAFAPPALVGACGDEGGPLLVSASADWTSRVWDAASGTCRGVHVGHAGAVTALALWDDRDGGGSGMSGGGGGGALRVVTGCQDGGVAVWAEGGELLGLHQAHAAPVRLLAAGAGANGCGVVTGGRALLRGECQRPEVLN